MDLCHPRNPLAHTPRLRRRDLGTALAGSAAALALPTVLAGEPAAAAPPSDTVRLLSVVALQTGGLLAELIATFQAAHPYQVTVSFGEADDLYARARAGEADLVTTHLGVGALPDAVGDRTVRWPQLVLTTAHVFVAHRSDPAGIAGTADPVEAFRRIAMARAPFVRNDADVPAHVTDVLREAIGRPDETGWYLDTGLSGAAAAREAARLGGYTLWGLHPFLGLQQQEQLALRPVLYRDPIMHRAIASVVVNPGRGRRVNLPGALALQRFLTAPATQAQLLGFRHPLFDQPIFWPAAHHNDHG
jgi:tungstate transport system substrate-binding protein